MNIVDSSAWLSYFADDGNAQYFAEPIEHTAALLVPSITLSEVFKVILRQQDEDVALAAIAQMEQGLVVALDSHLAIDAAYYVIKYKLPLADSIIYATAMKYDAIIWTQDDDFELLDRVRYFPKLNKK
ncbi:type II toxin-antitoxin system VapC family toxin [Chamaesiphon sp. GL140_3_metabinner_50]|uniref:type II toxin-antitoxin system VapC family toxin n=1 Tax=Chamaesiphon sp. GL140_3_metabinner_50 TaxID=2970812 RepID=UPI0025EF8CB3|nr:type II toxin-antitoxin system VapC family toxin [Chamaesiphon sp. GL140_3_metabinner_50]